MHPGVAHSTSASQSVLGERHAYEASWCTGSRHHLVLRQAGDAQRWRMSGNVCIEHHDLCGYPDSQGSKNSTCSGFELHFLCTRRSGLGHDDAAVHGRAGVDAIALGMAVACTHLDAQLDG